MITHIEAEPGAEGRASRKRTNRIIALAVTATAVLVAAGMAATLITSSALLGAITADASRAAQHSTLNDSGAVDQTSSVTATGATGTASAAQARGIVDIDTVLAYQGAEAAGTGMVLTADGEVLTNNHVVEGATAITVTIVSTGRRYSASVVGTDATDDVAVLKLAGASGLATASIAGDDVVGTGDRVTAVGNAGGTGRLVAAPGTVAATGQTITTQAEESVASETLNGLIETDAAIVAGDSGGPLYNASGRVIGMDTAASTGGTGGGLGGGGGSGGSGYVGSDYGTSARTGSAAGEQAYGAAGASATAAGSGYAIPIADALAIVRQIEAGKASNAVQLGSPAFLGVEIGSGSLDGYGYGYGGGGQGAGAVVEQVVEATPAASAGLVPGDIIVSLGRASITSASGLTAALGQHKPGQQVQLGWLDAAGSRQTATVTLATGPAA